MALNIKPKHTNDPIETTAFNICSKFVPQKNFNKKEGKTDKQTNSKTNQIISKQTNQKKNKQKLKSHSRFIERKKIHRRKKREIN